MYLHLGNEVIVKIKDIVGIFDIENSSVSKYTKDYLSRAEREGRVIYCSMDMPKSFVVCDGGGQGERVYVSMMSCSTLLKRFKRQIKGKY